MEELSVKRPLDIRGGYAEAFRDVLEDYSLGAIIQCLSLICEEKSRHATIVVDNAETKRVAKRWKTDQATLQTALARILELGSDSTCR